MSAGRGARWAARVALLCAVLAAGCRAPGSAAGLRGTVNTGGWPFVPSAVRVYPLTHLEAAREGKGEARIIAHLDFRDAWGDSTKAVGPLSLLVYGPENGLEGGENVQLRRYDVDLSDLRRNAELFDPATRTYRVPLGGLPEWMGQLASRAAAGDGRALGEVRVTLRAELTSPRADGSEAVLKDEYVLTK